MVAGVVKISGVVVVVVIVVVVVVIVVVVVVVVIVVVVVEVVVVVVAVVVVVTVVGAIVDVVVSSFVDKATSGLMQSQLEPIAYFQFIMYSGFFQDHDTNQKCSRLHFQSSFHLIRQQGRDPKLSHRVWTQTPLWRNEFNDTTQNLHNCTYNIDTCWIGAHWRFSFALIHL